MCQWVEPVRNSLTANLRYAMRGQASQLRNTSAALLLTIATACGGELPTHPEWDGTGVLGEYIIYNGTKRIYTLNVPSSYKDSKPAPLLIMFHGAGDTGPNFQRWNGLDSMAEAGGIITAYPNGNGAPCFDDVPPEECEESPPFQWQLEDLEFIRQLIAHLKHELTIDPNRIYGAGFSNGAVFAYQVGCELADEFAGVGAISGLMKPLTALDCNPSRPVRVLMVNGTEDAVFAWEGGPFLSASSTVSFWATINGCVGEPEVEWLPDTRDDGTRVWTESYRDCDSGAKVLFYGIEGGGHTWPGVSGFPSRFGLTSQDISVDEEIVKFFTRPTRR
jgi:polyhydroxybutyrate depolymerase